MKQKNKPQAAKPAHTPGPWYVAGYGILGPKGILADSIAVTSVRENERNIAGLSKMDQPEREANARLIAAAPDLLALLDEGQQRAVDIDNDNGREDLLAWAQDARAAIAKAQEGR